ncbi:MAG TPA: glycosyltransferase family A protein [Solirubrobacteraceae bacterium]|nr:glycosyltransferase family A protein [Solirubrobacteraceae bacterium]
MSAEPRQDIGLVVPAYNAERFLAQALESALAQSRPPTDIVVVDDGSSDRTTAVAKRFGSPVRVVSQPNGGIGAARNHGMALVGGELVAFLDADDLLSDGSLVCRAHVLERRSDVDMVFGAVRRFSEILDGAPLALNEPQPGQLPAAMLIRRTALDRVGAFLTDTHVAEGLDWMLRARELGLGELTLEEQVIWRRVHGENNSLRHRGEIGEFARALKASLDRRRSTGRIAAEEQR